MFVQYSFTCTVRTVDNCAFQMRNFKYTTCVELPDNIPLGVTRQPQYITPFKVHHEMLSKFRRSYTNTYDYDCTCDHCSEYDDSDQKTTITLRYKSTDNVILDRRDYDTITFNDNEEDDDDDEDDDDEDDDDENEEEEDEEDEEDDNDEDDNEDRLQVLSEFVSEHIGVAYDSHYSCFCKRNQSVCGCGCDPAHDGW